MKIKTQQNRTQIIVPGGLIGATSGLSRGIIPVVAGQFYSYTTRLTSASPIFTAMHCKSNKARAIREASILSHQASLLFRFQHDGINVMPIAEARNANLLDCSASFTHFGRNSVTPTSLNLNDFSAICSSKDRVGLFETTRCAVNGATSTHLAQEIVFAFQADDGRHGLFVVTESTSDAAQIVACHSS